MTTDEAQTGFEDLLRLAQRLGANHAKVIPTSDIEVEDDLASLCREQRCESYGQASSCPPYVSGPSGFRKLLKDFKQALVFRIDVPLEILFSSERRDIFRLLHEIAAGIEQSAVQMGYPNSRAYAGGSCKKLFCEAHENCRVAHGDGTCRNPDHARPSMSGFGINVSKLVSAAGWTMHRGSPGTGSGPASTGMVCGLVLIG